MKFKKKMMQRRRGLRCQTKTSKKLKDMLIKTMLNLDEIDDIFDIASDEELEEVKPNV